MRTIIGSPVSPYVRKVLAVLFAKSLEFDIAPISPFFGDDEFSKLSPLRRVPVLIDGETIVNDSTVIIQYLEETYPEPSVLPKTPALRARARWFEEFADSRMGDVFIWRGFAPYVVAPLVFGAERDEAAFRHNCETDVVAVMDYLESEAPTDGFLAGDISIGDFAVAVMFRNLRYTKWTPDAARWPRTTAWLSRVEADPHFAKATDWSDGMATAKPVERRARAKELGIKLSEKTYANKTPRKGPMTVIG